ncbi:tetratricopeptide repeat protein [Sphingomonas sp. ST-64]|uniref:Tetratricopeptide repeat protein n=1 Tax=Sphingomonas plantiphila TaxID=3163295 RepID=A0ABW8YU95_9SPHN
MLPGVAHADLGAYVKARAAAADGAVDAAAAGYAAALAEAPGDEVVAIRAYRNALAAGDIALARRAAAVLVRSGVAPADTAILEFADAVRTRDRLRADDALGRIGSGPLDFLAPVLRAWLAFDRGADPFPILDNAGESGLSRRYIAEHRALLLIASKRLDEGVAALRAAVGADPGSIDLRWNAATLLAGTGRERIAREVLSGDDPVITALRGGLRKSRPGAAFGTSRLLTRLAADLSGQETQALSILLARSALLLDPGDDRAKLLLAAALAGERAFDRAILALDTVRPDSPFHGAALAERVGFLREQDEPERALALARGMAMRRGADPRDLQRYADNLSDLGQDAEAARVYQKALEMAGASATWVHHLQLGGALERSGQWEAALPHLRKAVELAPEQPVALNYLGYAQIERGENLNEAVALLERASRLRPDDPAITDSLGWGYLRSGDVAKALPLLERAAQGQPSSPTINEHLGDAYWKSGRRFEARYAWRAAAVYAEGEQKGRLTTKLADGLAQRTAAN